MLRPTSKDTGRVLRTQVSGERPREARRERELRDVMAAINKGHRNQQITEFFKK